MKKVLFVAYQIPPIGGPAAQRHIRFLVRLGEFKWTPIVLTVKPECSEDYFPKDDSLLRWLPEDLQIHRTTAFNPMDRLLEFRKNLQKRYYSHHQHHNRGQNEKSSKERPIHKNGFTQRIKDLLVELFRIPDRQAGWIPFAVLKGIRLIRSKDISLIYSSGNPWSAHIIGLLLSKYSGLPWVADFRDPWIGNPYKQNKPAIIESIEKRLERGVISTAKRIVTNTFSLREHFLHNYPEEDPKKFVHISNGFFAPMFESLKANHNQNKKLIISHIGTIYMHRNPIKLFEALAELKQNGLINQNDITLRFIGKIALPDIHEGLLAKLKIDDLVEFIGMVPHQIALQHLAGSDILLLIQPGTKLQIPGKLFEYIAVRKPILALADEGETSNLINKEKLGIVVNPEAKHQLKKILLDLINDHKMSRIIVPNKEATDKFESIHLTKKLSEVFNSCL